MKLYSFTGSCGLASNIVLEWAGADYEVELLEKTDTKKDAFLKLNPNGKVPTMDIDGWILDENEAILNYLADAYPDAKLNGGGDIRQRAEVGRWLGLINSDIHPAYKPLFGVTAYLDDPAAIEKSKQHAKDEVRRYFSICNDQLATNDFIAGTRSIADAYLFVTLAWSHKTGVDISDFKHLQAYEARLLEDKGVKAALKAQKLA